MTSEALIFVCGDDPIGILIVAGYWTKEKCTPPSGKIGQSLKSIEYYSFADFYKGKSQLSQFHACSSLLNLGLLKITNIAKQQKTQTNDIR